MRHLHRTRQRGLSGRQRWSGVWSLGIFLVLAPVVLAQFATTDVRVTDTLTHGSVHWTEGFGRSWGSATGATRRGATVVARQEATQAARQELARLFAQLRLDATQTLAQAIHLSEGRPQALEALLAQAAVVETSYKPRGAVETAVQLAFAGPFMALFLPSAAPIAQEGAPQAESVHTGIVIDARGLAIQPALFPKIVDEHDQPLYTPELVEREAAIQQGYVIYARAFDQAPVPARIGENPLVVRALRVAGATRVDLVLSQAEASRLRDYTATHRLLRQCRIVIVM